MPTHLKTCLCLASFSFLLIATPSLATAASFKVCDLMTQQMAAIIYGGPVAPGRIEMANAGMSDCRFDGVAGGGDSEIGVMDGKAMGMPAAAMLKVLSTEKEAGHTIESILGLGEAAYINKGPDDLTLSVLVRGQILIVAATKPKGAGTRDALIQAARQALGKV